MGFWFVLWLLESSKENSRCDCRCECNNKPQYVKRKGYFSTLYELPMNRKHEMLPF